MHDATSEPAAITRLTELVVTKVIWAALVVADAAGWATAFVNGPQQVRSRSRAQGLVEWSLAAAVLALVGIAAWQLAGTAITDAVNRTIGSLNRAGA